MHRVSISMVGAINVTESQDVKDEEALPLFIKLKGVLAPVDVRPRTRRKPAGSPGNASEGNAGEVRRQL